MSFLAHSNASGAPPVGESHATPAAAGSRLAGHQGSSIVEQMTQGEGKVPKFLSPGLKKRAKIRMTIFGMVFGLFFLGISILITQLIYSRVAHEMSYSFLSTAEFQYNVIVNDFVTIEGLLQTNAAAISGYPATHTHRRSLSSLLVHGTPTQYSTMGMMGWVPQLSPPCGKAQYEAVLAEYGLPLNTTAYRYTDTGRVPFNLTNDDATLLVYRSDIPVTADADDLDLSRQPLFLDTRSTSTRGPPADEAIATGNITSSCPATLANGRSGVIVFLPTYWRNDTMTGVEHCGTAAGDFRGFVIAAIWGGAASSNVRHATASLGILSDGDQREDALWFALTEMASGDVFLEGPAEPVAPTPEGTGTFSMWYDSRDFYVSRQFEAYGRRWLYEASPSEDFFDPALLSIPTITFALSFSLCLLMGSLLICVFWQRETRILGSDLKRSLAEAEVLAQEQIISLVHHEIKNPLHLILAAYEYLYAALQALPLPANADATAESQPASAMRLDMYSPRNSVLNDSFGSLPPPEEGNDIPSARDSYIAPAEQPGEVIRGPSQDLPGQLRTPTHTPPSPPPPKRFISHVHGSNEHDEELLKPQRRRVLESVVSVDASNTRMRLRPYAPSLSPIIFRPLPQGGGVPPHDAPTAATRRQRSEDRLFRQDRDSLGVRHRSLSGRRLAADGTEPSVSGPGAAAGKSGQIVPVPTTALVGMMEDVESLGHAAQHLKRQVEELLESSQMRSGKFNIQLAAVQLAPLVRRICKDHEVMKAATIDCFIDSLLEEQYFTTDSYRVRQLLANGLTNACKASKANNGAVSVRMLYLAAPRTPEALARILKARDVSEASAMSSRLLRNVARKNQVATATAEGSASAPLEGWIMLFVEDTGPGLGGVDPELLFQPYVSLLKSDNSSSLGGTGLGLPIARKLSRAMGGDVVLRDTGSGAQYVVVLPMPTQGSEQVAVTTAVAETTIDVHHEEEMSSSTPSRSGREPPDSAAADELFADMPAVPPTGMTAAVHALPAAPAPKRYVLVVDDDPMNCRLALRMLKKLGMEGEEVSTPEVSFVEDTKQLLLLHNGLMKPEDDSHRSFDAVLLDLHLKQEKGENLFAALQEELKKEVEFPPVFAVSGTMTPDDQLRLQQAGFAGALEKPFGVKELKALLRAK